MLKPEHEKKLKYAAKGLKAVKAISNALGTKPTDTPEVDTKIKKKFKKSKAGTPGTDVAVEIDDDGYLKD